MVMADTKDKNREYIDLDREFVNPVLSRLAPIVAEYGQGSYLVDVNGTRYLDLTTGIAVNNVGHCHPRVVAAIKEQAEKLLHTSVTTYHKGYIETAKKIAEISPAGLDSVFLANSGAECVEGALKLARYVTGRPAFINFQGGFHGRTHMCMAMTTSKLVYREGYEPLAPSVFTAPFPYVFRSETPDNPDAVVDHTFEYLEMLFRQFVSPAQVAAFLVEPVLGEGGYVVPPKGFLSRLRKLADEKGILLIIDEVQTGFARTGRMFACEHEPVVPDIMTMAKGIAAGMPLSAFVTTRELSAKWLPGRHGSTFGGNPVSCAAALASIAVIEEEKLAARADSLGNEMMRRLREFSTKHKQLVDVRGLGLMIGLEFGDANGKPSKEWADKVAARCFDEKLLVLTCGQQGQVIRLIPPLTLSDSEADQALTVLEKAIAAG